MTRTPKPLWRWWLFCFALHFRAYDLMAWCVLPEWLGVSCLRHDDCCAAWKSNPEEKTLCEFPPDNAEVPF